MQPVPTADFLQLIHRPELQMLIARWMRQTTAEEMRAGYQHLLRTALEHNCRLWLVDARRRDHSNKEGTPWMIETFFPQVAQRMGPSVYMAYLFAPAHLRDIEADAAVPTLHFFDDRPYHLQRFLEERTAMEWLAACRLQLAQVPQPGPAQR
ncbi:hypothetical protein [Hymenobacter elongatus]|uniref:STAS/SEC14 domain-containing protein n=1 Tax=Hymenobacter elongatus TaxID=877208 RepID=A0A4Z0PQX3_9BACT|nr:hypothetical protein [Hymenobacter elongatus]TGE19749.1 hypothetical protein E5J99_03030 [Hymenobacter elongatus]